MYRIRFRLGAYIWGAYSALLYPWLHLRGPTIKGRGGEERKNEGEKEGRKGGFGPPIFTTYRHPCFYNCSIFHYGSKCTVSRYVHAYSYLLVSAAVCMWNGNGRNVKCCKLAFSAMSFRRYKLTPASPALLNTIDFSIVVFRHQRNSSTIYYMCTNTEEAKLSLG